jgi:hypothetical protein
VFKDGPALVIQSGHGVRLRRLVLRGLNDWSSTFEPTDLALHLQQELLGTDPYLSPGIRDLKAAPHARQIHDGERRLLRALLGVWSALRPIIAPMGMEDSLMGMAQESVQSRSWERCGAGGIGACQSCKPFRR